jgi:transposase-like protein
MGASFLPPFCPRSSCRFHRYPAGWRYKRIGFYLRQCQPHRIQRYLCLHCRRSFSTQTFTTTYWLRRPALLIPLFYRLLACSGFRQIARELNAAPSTLVRLAARLGRHCLLFQRLHQPPVKEPVALDGFESFEWSQYFPFHFHVLVGCDSHFFYGFTDSPLRRKGAMTARQKVRRAQLEQQLGRPDPSSIRKEVAALLRFNGLEQGAVALFSDDHSAYPRAFRTLPDLTVHHFVTSSLERRTTTNPLFPVNLLDLLIRHGSANHKRETIAFSKRRQGAIERLALLQVWRNFIKPFSEQHGGGTPAQRLKQCDRALTVKEILRWRLFPSRIEMPERLMAYYRREVITPALAHHRFHRLTYAF